MKSSHYNLPDGVSPDDIDIAFGAAYRCPHCRMVVDAGRECPRCSRDPDREREEQSDDKQESKP
jgi:hypothetical protein